MSASAKLKGYGQWQTRLSEDIGPLLQSMVRWRGGEGKEQGTGDTTLTAGHAWYFTCDLQSNRSGKVSICFLNWTSLFKWLIKKKSFITVCNPCNAFRILYRQSVYTYIASYIICYRAVSGVSLKIVSDEAFVFFVFSRNQENTEPLTWRSVSSDSLGGSTIAIISAHVPGPHMRASAVPGQSSPKQWKSDGRVKIDNSVSTKSPLTKYKKRNIIESSNIKARVSVHWRAQCHAKWPRGSREFQHHAEIEPKSPDSLQLTLTSKPGSSQSIETNGIWLVVFRNLQPIFCKQDCRSGWFKLKIKARHQIPEFLNANLW